MTTLEYTYANLRHVKMLFSYALKQLRKLINIKLNRFGYYNVSK